MTQLFPALQSFTRAGSPFHRAVLSHGSLVVPIWQPKNSKHDGGLVVQVPLLCNVDHEIDEVAIMEDWRALLVKKQVTSHGPWLSKVSVVHRVQNVAKVIDIFSRQVLPPPNLVQIPAAAIIDVFGNRRDRFQIWRRHTL